MLSTDEVKPSQIIAVWSGDIWPLSAHQDPLAAAGHMVWGRGGERAEMPQELYGDDRRVDRVPQTNLLQI